jgi:hypothetical protein
MINAETGILQHTHVHTYGHEDFRIQRAADLSNNYEYLRRSSMIIHIVNEKCLYKGVDRHQNSKIQEPERTHNDRPIACVFAMQYSSASIPARKNSSCV